MKAFRWPKTTVVIGQSENVVGSSWVSREADRRARSRRQHRPCLGLHSHLSAPHPSTHDLSRSQRRLSRRNSPWLTGGRDKSVPGYLMTTERDLEHQWCQATVDPTWPYPMEMCCCSLVCVLFRKGKLFPGSWNPPSLVCGMFGCQSGEAAHRH